MTLQQHTPVAPRVVKQDIGVRPGVLRFIHQIVLSCHPICSSAFVYGYDKPLTKLPLRRLWLAPFLAFASSVMSTSQSWST